MGATIATGEAGLLRFATAGSVDDGKSTLIGRLLYDSKTLFDDQVEQLESDFDLARLTDGLRAEREQGITIDVAYRFFATPARRFILADCPGHIEYTRNAYTGMSTADVALLLVDARQGVLEQTRRHTFLAALLRVPRIVFCINKMDLVGYDAGVFTRISDEVETMLSQTEAATGYRPRFDAIPVSALTGENVASSAARLAWFEGPHLLQHLETMPLEDRDAAAEARLYVQVVLRRDRSSGSADLRRAYAGTLAGGRFHVGDEVVILPHGRHSTITDILVGGTSKPLALSGDSIAGELADHVDASRGSVIALAGAAPALSRELATTVCWMSDRALLPGALLEVKLGTTRVKAKVSRIRGAYNFEQGSFRACPDVGLNAIARVDLKTSAPLAVDPYASHAPGGRMLLIDPATRETLGTAIVDDVS
ncbi:MAG: GTP-binding protein [Myxococcota bacterium]